MFVKGGKRKGKLVEILNCLQGLVINQKEKEENDMTLYGHVNGEKLKIEDSVEQICAFIKI